MQDSSPLGTGFLLFLIVGLSICFYNDHNDLQKKLNEANNSIALLSDTSTQKYNQSAMLNACLADAQTNYNADWNNSCNSLGLSNSCSLPLVQVNLQDQRFKDNKDECYRHYPQN